MEYSKLLDLATELGYQLAMCGAETFRVEESISRVLAAYDIEAEVFVIPNCMHISIEPVLGRPLTRMRRIGSHGNDLDAVERFSGLSRRICEAHPDPEIARQWLEETKQSRRSYAMPMYLAGNFLGAFGFALLFGGVLIDGLCAGICGILVGLVNHFMKHLDANQFFRTISAAFPMALLAYAMDAVGLAYHVDAVIIGALMILVPGLLFTNAMRDIIFGDTNSGINRFVQVLLIALAIALGTAVAWNLASALWGAPSVVSAVAHPIWLQCLACIIGGIGFSILFNIHGFGGMLCVVGGVLAWLAYTVVAQYSGSDLTGYLAGALLASLYSELMARFRKYPAISYLVVSIFPLIPGAGVYYTMNYAVQGQMDAFASQGMHTAAIAGIIAVGILLVSTTFRLWNTWKRKHRRK
ncbi:MAG: threonine/serine exporter family protein [Firmicutes bacterium]|nr:threonine/serine exporter family protein [Bacillota bacterium]